MRVLFIHKVYFSEPMGIMYLSAALRRRGHETDFFDIGLEEDVAGYVQRTRPDVIGYSLVSGSHQVLFDVTRELKQVHEFFSVFGGPHATYFPECIEEEGVDAVCRGEAEEALVDLVDRLESGRDIRDTANFWFMIDGVVHRNEPRHLTEDLDSLAFPDRRLLDRYPQYAGLTARRIITARGCPFNCSYCYNRALGELYKGKGRKLRRRSIDNVMREVREVFAHSAVHIIHISDDTFVIDLAWLNAFAEAYEPMAVPVTCYARAEFINDDVADSLRRIRCVGMHIGIESADEDLRRRLLHRKMTNELLENVTTMLRRHEVPYVSQSMIGLPGETLDDALATMRFNARIKPSYAAVSIFQPYPGTELAQVAYDMGLVERTAMNFPANLWGRSLLRLEKVRQFENLAQLFPIAVAYPPVIPLVIALIRLPSNALFRLAGGLFKSFMFFRLGYLRGGDVLRWVPNKARFWKRK